jgi:AraC-like DNA-binding protein
MPSKEIVRSSKDAPSGALAFDRLAVLLERFRVRASLFHVGALCGVSTFEAVPGRAFVHILRRGQMRLRHRVGARLQPWIRIDEPTLLLYAQPVHHVFHNPPHEGSDLTCATLDFDGAERNPLVQALPPLVQVPLSAVPGLQPALELLFAEAGAQRCGSRLLADRLFEVVLIQLLRWMLDHPQQVGIDCGLFAGMSDPRLARALAAVHAQPQAAWSLERMAAQAGMSRSAFAAAFRQTTGTTPAQYLVGWRLTLAASLLKAGHPVKWVADETGFATAASLTKAFSQRYGSPPKRWARVTTSRPESVTA